MAREAQMRGATSVRRDRGHQLIALRLRLAFIGLAVDARDFRGQLRLRVLQLTLCSVPRIPLRFLHLDTQRRLRRMGGVLKSRRIDAELRELVVHSLAKCALASA